MSPGAISTTISSASTVGKYPSSRPVASSCFDPAVGAPQQGRWMSAARDDHLRGAVVHRSTVSSVGAANAASAMVQYTPDGSAPAPLSIALLA